MSKLDDTRKKGINTVIEAIEVPQRAGKAILDKLIK